MEIPVKKTSGVPWWVWLILALLVVALIWWFLAGRNDDSERNVANDQPALAAVTEPEDRTAAAANSAGSSQAGDALAQGSQTGVITDLSMILDAQDPAALVGREFRLTGVRVLDVVGDRTFWVGDGADRRAFAALREAPPANFPQDAAIDINSNQTVSIAGVINSGADSSLGGRPLQDMPPGTPIVLVARTAEVQTRP